jgi:hypothetical protein
MVALNRYIDPVVNDNAFLQCVARRGRDPTSDTARELGISQHFALSIVLSEGARMLSPARRGVMRLYRVCGRRHRRRECNLPLGILL